MAFISEKEAKNEGLTFQRSEDTYICYNCNSFDLNIDYLYCRQCSEFLNRHGRLPRQHTIYNYVRGKLVFINKEDLK